jgi:hypothetical protein
MFYKKIDKLEKDKLKMKDDMKIKDKFIDNLNQELLKSKIVIQKILSPKFTNRNSIAINSDKKNSG